MTLIISWIGNNSLWKKNRKRSIIIHAYPPIPKSIEKMMIRSQNCIKCLLIIAVIRSMHESLKRIVDHHNLDPEMLKLEMRYVISKILDILIGI